MSLTIQSIQTKPIEVLTISFINLIAKKTENYSKIIKN